MNPPPPLLDCPPTFWYSLCIHWKRCILPTSAAQLCRGPSLRRPPHSGPMSSEQSNVTVAIVLSPQYLPTLKFASAVLTLPPHTSPPPSTSTRDQSRDCNPHTPLLLQVHLTLVTRHTPLQLCSLLSPPGSVHGSVRATAPPGQTFRSSSSHALTPGYLLHLEMIFV